MKLIQEGSHSLGRDVGAGCSGGIELADATTVFEEVAIGALMALPRVGIHARSGTAGTQPAGRLTGDEPALAIGRGPLSQRQGSDSFSHVCA